MGNLNLMDGNSNKWMKKFIPIWSAQIFSLLGSGLVQFALVWYLTQKTGSTTILAMATFVAVIANVVVGPFAGALVDRWNRRLVMIFADGAVAFVTLILVILFAVNKLEVWQIFVALFLRGTGGVFHSSAMSSSTSLMVPEKHLSRVAGINQAINGSLNIVAPPLGALLMTILPFYQVIAIDVVTAIIAITPLLFIHIPQPLRADREEVVTVKMVMKDLVEGFRFMKSWPGIMILTFVAAFINFMLAPSDTFLPLLVTKHFMKGVWELGIIQSCFGFGVVGGGLLLGIWGGFKSKITTSMVGVIGIGLGVFLMGIAPGNMFYLGVVGMTLSGLMNSIANGPLQAIMQSKIPPEKQGRVMGLTGSICTAMIPISMLVSAPVTNAMGLQFWYWVGGAMTILLGISAFFIPQLMALDNVELVTNEASVTIN